MNLFSSSHVNSKNIFSKDFSARSEIEKIAMASVMKIEKNFGNNPVDVSAKKIGYDIESATDNGLKFIEVKGRNFSADLSAFMFSATLKRRR